MDLTMALAILANGFADAMQIQAAREYMCQYPMDQLYEFSFDDRHMDWFQQHHRHHYERFHGGMGGFGTQTFVQERRDMFGNEAEIIDQCGPFGQRREEIVQRDMFGNETIIERDDPFFGGW